MIKTKKETELEIRLKHNGAVKRNGKIFCAVHTETELTKDGKCKTCIENENIIGMDMAEARAAKLSDIIAENGLENLEENLPYYDREEALTGPNIQRQFL